MQAEIEDGIGNADVYSISKIAQFMVLGTVEYAADDLEGQMSEEMREFLKKSESESPY